MKKCGLIALVALFFLGGCDKQQLDSYSLVPLSDYFPLQTGKYITYDLDSTTYPNFGTMAVITHYQVQYYTDSTITDNLGRTAYRIIRYIRDSSTAPWVPDNTFLAINTGNTIEWIEDNFRFIKLSLPILPGSSWQGNRYLYTYTSDDTVTTQITPTYLPYTYLDNWTYSYDSINTPLTLGNLTVDSTIKVNEQDVEVGIQNNPNYYSSITYSSENYAKGIGLVYRRFLYQEYQPPVNGQPGYYNTDGYYGITLTMIDHN
jgi:hypothetical protein